MAKSLGISERQIERALAELESVKMVQKASRWQVGLHGHGTVYTATVPGVDAYAAPAATKTSQMDIDDVITGPVDPAAVAAVMAIPAAVEYTNEPTPEDVRYGKRKGARGGK